MDLLKLSRQLTIWYSGRQNITEMCSLTKWNIQKSEAATEAMDTVVNVNVILLKNYENSWTVEDV